MRPPSFWQNPVASPGLWALILAPLGWVYGTVTARRVAKAGYKARVPVICIGNISVGGVGKTPTAMALVERLLARGHKVHVVSRGYGGQMSGPVQVDINRHSAAEVGDEPLLLAAFAPTWVAKDRAAGVRAAENAGAEVILLDDGFQNPSVKKDLSIVVVDAEQGFGNGRCLPAGPLREPVSAGLSRAGLVLAIGAPAAVAGFQDQWGTHLHQLLISGQLQPIEMGIDWTSERVIAFAGIGRPEKFFATLRGLGATVLRAEALDDHQPLSDGLMRRLLADAIQTGAQLVTTEKDAARLPAAFRSQVLTLPVRLHLQDATALDAALGGIGL